MNKTQKKNLATHRRFYQNLCKKTKHMYHMIMVPPVIEGGYSTPVSSVNMDVVYSLTLKELEYLIESKQMTQEGYNEKLFKVLYLELAERRLLLSKSTSI